MTDSCNYCTKTILSFYDICPDWQGKKRKINKIKFVESKENKSFQGSNNIWLFLSIVLLLTWSCWLFAILSEELRSIFHYLGGAIPLILTVFFLTVRSNKSYRKEYWARVIDHRSITQPYLLIILLVVPTGYLFHPFSLNLFLLVGFIAQLLGCSSNAHSFFCSLQSN